MEWHQDPERESRERDKERAEDLGLSGFDFIGREDDRAVCRALGEFLTHRLHQTFVSPEAIGALHPEIMPATACRVATDVSIQLLQLAVERLFDSPVKDLRADIFQILHGTNMGTHEGLSMLCLGLREDPESVLVAARYRAAPFEESSSGDAAEHMSPPRQQIPATHPERPRSTWLRQQESSETIRALGKIMSSTLESKMVSSDAFQALHPDIPREMAQGGAYELSLLLVMARLRAMPHHHTVDHCSLNQILRGTLSGRAEVLEALCRALEVSSAQVLSQARVEGKGIGGD